MRVQIITRDNGFGLSRDIQVLREALPDHEIDFTPIDHPRKGGHWHWNIHLELVNPAHFRSGSINVFVPNPEWTQMAWMPYLSGFDAIWAKTLDCERIFVALHPNVVYTGWTSPDIPIRVDRDRMAMIHCAGDSLAKGTRMVMAAAALVPDAHVGIISNRPLGGMPDNVTVHRGYIEQARYDDLRKAPIHLCPSSYEGFGHYINEARAMGATIITTDAPPMNEIVDTSYGILAPVCATRRQHLAEECDVCVDALAESMRFALANDKAHGGGWGTKARRAYDADRIAFHERINALMR